MLNYLWFFLAALFEIGGCYAFWLWLRMGKSAWWVVPGLLSLTLFALLLTRVEAAYAGRAYAAYGGIYIVASLLWLGVVERTRPLASDWLGAALCVMGATIILLGPRFSQS
ncbi:YnfA family protein [Pseudomonas sp. JS3066]|jgi:small multidrug resistance family-3 protein|uniref:YnfA family protein n=1 Tax=unclassified Pseudomonas TaxID=196821 RepID=UPI000EAA28E4|nr:MULTISPECIES: YnfA family protein [unclassified Pseudomonas]AYF88044.1 YnfA family protein [Pseudomonas sp. DY-1]MDH4654043.1 YnfA family protein [Pseudomonas sp. BN606]MRK23387.1 YnfA family protein [Pseudomonas sp. JG-B]WVK94383.1 YnfA family protein [Pseudomonas sp. JS3066]